RLLIPQRVSEYPPGRIIFVPDSLLTDVPVSALLDSAGVFLIERSAIELSPSASLSVACRKKESSAFSRASATGAWSALIFGPTRGVPEHTPALLGAAS